MLSTDMLFMYKNQFVGKNINFFYSSCSASAFKFGHETILIDNKLISLHLMGRQCGIIKTLLT